MYGGSMPMWLDSFPSTWPSQMLVAKLDRETGRLDDRFGDKGVTQVDFGAGDRNSWAFGEAIVRTQGGKLVAIGTAVDANNSDVIGTALPKVAAAMIDLADTGHPGIIGFAATQVPISGSQDRTVVEVRRTGGSRGVIAVDYEAISGTITAAPAFGTLVWNDGDTSAKKIEISFDRLTDTLAYQKFDVVLGGATSALAATKAEIVNRQAFNPAAYMHSVEERHRGYSLASSIPSAGVANNPAGPSIAPPAAAGGGGALGVWVPLLLALALCGRVLARVRCALAKALCSDTPTRDRGRAHSSNR
jgi:hypothetical protein